MDPLFTPAWVVYHPDFEHYRTGKNQLERPERCKVIMDALLKKGITDDAHILTPRKATFDEVALCHSPSYLKKVETECKNASIISNTLLSTGDVYISPASYQTALLAAGAVLTAVDAVMKGTTKKVFCNIRPPGHHATPEKGHGFCLINNVALGALYLLKHYPQIEKVLIVDWDLHHGDGTQHIFYHNPSVYYFSTHAAGIFPGTGFSHEIGEGKAAGTTMNVPLSEKKGSHAQIIAAFKDKLMPAMENFKPDFVFISAGFDAHKEDYFQAFDLENSHFVVLTELVKEIADKYAKGRIISVLEGGYTLNVLKKVVPAHVKALFTIT